MLVGTGTHGPDIALAEVRLGPDGKCEEDVMLTPLGKLPSSVRAAVVRYSLFRRSPGRREWVLLLESGEVLSNRSPDKPWRPSSPPPFLWN